MGVEARHPRSSTPIYIRMHLLDRQNNRARKHLCTRKSPSLNHVSHNPQRSLTQDHCTENPASFFCSFNRLLHIPLRHPFLWPRNREMGSMHALNLAHCFINIMVQLLLSSPHILKLNGISSNNNRALFLATASKSATYSPVLKD